MSNNKFILQNIEPTIWIDFIIDCVSISENQGKTLLNFTLSCFPASTRIYNTNFTDSNGPRWPRGYRLRRLTQTSRVRVPGAPVSKDTETHIPRMRVACNGQQYGVVNTYMLTNMSLNMTLTSCLWTCHQYGTQSKSLCSVLHTPN